MQISIGVKMSEECMFLSFYILYLGETQKTSKQTNLLCFPQKTSCHNVGNLELLAFNCRTSSVNKRTTKVCRIMYVSQTTQNIKKWVENFVLPIQGFFILFSWNVYKPILEHFNANNHTLLKIKNMEMLNWMEN